MTGFIIRTARLSPLYSCVSANKYGPGLWTVTSFAMANSSASANQVRFPYGHYRAQSI